MNTEYLQNYPNQELFKLQVAEWQFLNLQMALLLTPWPSEDAERQDVVNSLQPKCSVRGELIERQVYTLEWGTGKLDSLKHLH